jgi:hypothetical protein
MTFLIILFNKGWSKLYEGILISDYKRLLFKSWNTIINIFSLLFYSTNFGLYKEVDLPKDWRGTMVDPGQEELSHGSMREGQWEQSEGHHPG